MQLTIDLTNQPAAYGKRVIAMIEAFYGLPQTETVTLSQMREIAATVPSVPTPLPPQAVPSTAAADPQPSAPVVTPASSPKPSVPPVPAVPPVPVAAAPTAPVAPSSPAGVVLDTDGLPWDARIHSGSKAKNADGRWRAKKGLNDGGLVARVQAELRAVMAVPAADHVPMDHSHAGEEPVFTQEIPFATTPPAMPPVPEAPAAAAPFVPQPPPAAPAQMPAAIAAATTAPSAAPGAAYPTTMPELMPRVTGAMAEGKIPPTAMLDACKAVGLPDLPSLAHRPDLIPQVWAMLKASYPGVWS